MFRTFLRTLSLLACLPLAAAFADNGVQPEGGVSPAGTRRVLIVCGHPGDADHRTLFDAATAGLAGALRDKWGFTDVTILFGDKLPDAGAKLPPDTPPATQEALAAAALALRERTGPGDAVWVIALGHAHFDGRTSWFNLPGPDLNQQTFAKLFEGLACRECVFWITFPASGFYIKPLSAPGRVIISATEADREINETNFASVMAQVLDSPLTPLPQPAPAAPAATDTPTPPVLPLPEITFDCDRDGKHTLYDLYIAISRKVAADYFAETLLATEHSRLDDNGDGRGTELQIDYLSVEQGGRLKPGSEAPMPRATGDGAASRMLELPFQAPAPKTAPVTPETPPAETATEAEIQQME